MKLPSIPDHWRWKTVDKLGMSTRPAVKAGPFGSALKKEFYVESGYRIYGQEQVIAGDLSIGNYYVNTEKFNKLKSCEVKAGDILISLVGTFGKILVVPAEFEPGIINPRLVRLSLDPEKIDPRFFSRFFESPLAQLQMELQSHGGTMGILNAKNISQLSISLPPIAEQRRIAAILDKADGIRRDRKRAIQYTEELLRSAFLDMFGDPVSNPKDWKIVELGSLIVGKPNNGIFKKNHEYDGEMPVVWVKELFSGHVIDCSESRTLSPAENEVEKYGLKRGDVLFCRSSLKLGGIGFNNVFDGDDFSSLFECHVIRVSPDQQKINSIFLSYLLRLPGLRQQIISKSNTVTMSTIGQGEIKRIEIYLPPKRLQDKFEKFLRKTMESKTSLNKLESDNLFNSLLQRAFKGDL